jgi:flagellar basal-body rod protein FlgF
MPTAWEISALGMVNDLSQLNTISHNLANANTAGFKREIVVTQSFDRLLGGETPPLAGISQDTQAKLVPEIARKVDFSPGALQYTGNPLDVAIEGEAYFEMQRNQEVRYCRKGSFSIDASGRLSYGDGFVVSGLEGEILLLGGDATIDGQGKVYENDEYAGQLKLVRFSDPAGLVKTKGGMMTTQEGMAAEPASEYGVRQGYLEASNVRVADEMLSMMSVLRHFETTARVIKGYDEMLGTAISTIAEF